MKENCIFRLEAFVVDDGFQELDLTGITEQGKIAEFYLESMKEAEDKISQLLVTSESERLWSPENIVCFRVTRIPVGINLHGDVEPFYERLYTSDGRFFSEGPIHYDGSRVFCGRRQEDCAFKIGDIVMVDYGVNQGLGMAIIASLPITQEKCKSHPIGFVDDYDDRYTILNGDGSYIECHNHIEVTRVLPLPFEPSMHQRTILINGLKKYLYEEKSDT